MTFSSFPLTNENQKLLEDPNILLVFDPALTRRSKLSLLWWKPLLIRLDLCIKSILPTPNLGLQNMCTPLTDVHRTILTYVIYCTCIYIKFCLCKYDWQELHNIMFVTNRSTWKRCEICSKLTIKTSKPCQWLRSVAFLLTLNIFHTFS